MIYAINMIICHITRCGTFNNTALPGVAGLFYHVFSFGVALYEVLTDFREVFVFVLNPNF